MSNLEGRWRQKLLICREFFLADTHPYDHFTFPTREGHFHFHPTPGQTHALIWAQCPVPNSDKV